MENQAVINKLNKLAQLDIDAIRAYDQAIDKIDMAEIRYKITEFRNDHQRHVEELSQQIRELGGTPLEPTPDFKGLLIEGFTALRSITGIEGALKAMQGNEKLTNKAYEDALEEDDMPMPIRSLLIKNREDERRHLTYITQILADAPWQVTA